MVDEDLENALKKDDRKGFLSHCRSNPWVISTFVLGVVVLYLLFGSFSLTGNVISEKEASQKLLNLYTSQGVEGLSVSSVDKVSGVYQVNFDYMGQEVPVFITSDGKMLGSLADFPDEETLAEYNSARSDSSSGGSNSNVDEKYSSEQNAAIQEFSECLYQKGMRVYYADWCGHCHNLINTFGGVENAGKMMVQCQKSDGSAGTGAELCSKEEIRGFPTIKINGEGYSGARTFEAFASATGCTAPAL